MNCELWKVPRLGTRDGSRTQTSRTGSTLGSLTQTSMTCPIASCGKLSSIPVRVIRGIRVIRVIRVIKVIGVNRVIGNY